MADERLQRSVSAAPAIPEEWTVEERREQREFELTWLKWDRAAQVAIKVIPSFFWMVTTLGVAWLAAAQATGHGAPEWARLNVRLVGEATLTLVALLSAVYGWRTRRLNKDLIEELTPYRKALEEHLNPKRTSSQLTARGDTPPRDLP